MTLGSLAMLIAELQITMEAMQSLLVTSPLADTRVRGIASEISDSLRGREIPVRLLLLDPGGHLVPPGDTTATPAGENHAPPDIRTPAAARGYLNAPGILTVTGSPAVLEDPTTLILAAAADAVALVVEQGKTSRRSLQAARQELHAVGAHLVAAVLYGN